jgi:hypothetical protein
MHRFISIASFTLALAACNGGDDIDPPPDGEGPTACLFPSGRPCGQQEVCLGTRGNECNYAYCTGDYMLQSSAVFCTADTVALTGGSYNCDPDSLTIAFAPPPSPCPLGALYSIVDGRWGTCVPVSECAPLPCDARYGGDGCPSNYGCDSTSSTCVAD